MKVCFGFVTYNTYGNYDWTRICVSSFRRIFGPDVALFVVDHNRNRGERAFLARQGVVILENRTEQSHGTGLDVLTRHVRGLGYDVFVHIEPDCLIESDGWYRNLAGAIAEGYHMAGVNVMSFGPIHPCGTAWLLAAIPGSFRILGKGDEILSQEYRSLIDVPNTAGRRLFFSDYWDVGLMNWYLLARKGLAKAVPGDGLRHFWFSRERSPGALMTRRPELKPLLEPWLSVKVL